MRADYQIPASAKVSSECRDLLARLLTTSPGSRITIQGIQQHPWYIILAHPARGGQNGQHASREAAEQC